MNTLKKYEFILEGLDCANCANKIQYNQKLKQYNQQVEQYCTFETVVTKTSSEYDCIYALESLAYEYQELRDDIRADYWRSYVDGEREMQEKLMHRIYEYHKRNPQL